MYVLQRSVEMATESGRSGLTLRISGQQTAKRFADPTACAC